MKRLSLTFNTFRALAEDVLGVDGYREWSANKLAETAKKAQAAAREAYARLTPEQKAERIKARCGKTSPLEAALAKQLLEGGVMGVVLNDWQSVPIQGRMVPREADLKIPLGDGRKVVVLCDGEAFHGPRTIFGDPSMRIEADKETSEAYFSLGYSVFRYSESEIKSGYAAQHLLGALAKLKTVRSIYRNWCPNEERVS
jgi:hypothetical protein